MGILVIFDGFGWQKNKPNQSQYYLAPRFSGVEKANLKKQSQFVLGRICSTPFVKGNYDNKPAGGFEKNKANQACPEQRRMEPIWAEDK